MKVDWQESDPQPLNCKSDALTVYTSRHPPLILVSRKFKPASQLQFCYAAVSQKTGLA